MTIIIRSVDIESTGLKPPEAGVVEIGWCDVENSSPPRIGRPKAVYVNPGHPIPPEMSGIHHLVDSDVAAAPTFDIASEPILKDGVILCAYNAKFEKQFFTKPATWIDAYKVALHLAPNAPNHKLQTLRYWLKLKVDPDDAMPSHRAGPDSYVCAHLVARMLAKVSVTEMIEISDRPSLLPKFHFGMHTGKPLAEVPTDYLTWVAGPKGLKDDEDVLFTAQHHLKLRSAA